MNSGLLKAGVLCVDSSNQDILTVDPTDSKYSKVEYIIVDPSCSGSGKFMHCCFELMYEHSKVVFSSYFYE